MDYTIKWELVRNSVSTRLEEDSLVHTLDVNKKIKRQTKIFNQKLKKVRTVRSYKHFLSLKEQTLIECPDSETETDDEPGLDHEDYKKIYKDGGESKTGTLRKFLKLCTRVKGRPNYKNKALKKEGKKKLTAVCKKPARVPGSKNSKQSSTKSNTVAKGQETLLQCWIKSRIKPSVSNLEEKNSVPDAAKTASKRLRKKSLISENKNRDLGDNNEEIDCAENSMSNSVVQSIRNGSRDMSKSICSPESAVINDPMAGSHLKETLIIEEQSSSENHRSENLLESDHESQTLNVNINATEHHDAFGTPSNSGDIFNENNLYPEHDPTVSKAENDRKEVLLVPFETEKYTLTSDHDSGNNSLSDTNSLCGKHEKRYSEGMGRSNCNEKTAAKRNLDAAREKVIPLDEIKLDEVATRPDETDSLNDDSDTQHIELATENSLKKERGIGNDDDAAREGSPEFMDVQEINEQSEVESSAEDEANRGGSLLKIKNIENYEEGNEPANKRELCEQKKIQSLDNLTYGVIDCSDENVENMPTSVPNEQALGFTKSSVDYFFSSEESNNSHTLLVDEFSCVIAGVNENNTSEIINIDSTSNWTEKSKLENNEQLECNTSFTELNSFETRPRSLSPSSIKSSSSFCSRSYDEEFEHCVEAKLLVGADEQLKCDETRNDENLSEQDEIQSSLIESDKKQNDLATENVQVSANSEFVKRSSSSEIRSHDSNESLDIADSVPLPKSTTKKRPISSIDEDYRVFANVLSKKSRALKQTSNKQLEISSHVCEIPETELRELQPAENEDDPPNRSNEKQSTPKPKRKYRPRTLEEFVTTEALSPDMTKPHFQTKNITEDDEIWIMDIPKTINPQDLKDQVLLLGEKGTMTLGDDCYKVSSRRSKACNISCIFAKNKRRKEYEIVNVEAQGHIKFTQKHIIIPETELISSKVTTVPFPKNVWRRHPLLGTVHKTEI